MEGFKVGDLVRVTNDDSVFWEGEGPVMSIRPGMVYPYYVGLDGDEMGIPFALDELELV